MSGSGAKDSQSSLDGRAETYLAFALVVDFEIFRRSTIWGDCRRVQIAVFVRYKWLICFVILECKISRFLIHFQRPKQNPGMSNKGENCG